MARSKTVRDGPTCRPRCIARSNGSPAVRPLPQSTARAATHPASPRG
jgi:hypothetical protein